MTTTTLRPTLSLDFVNGATSPLITFVRALNTATRINSSGLLELVNADVPRINYAPATKQCLGLLIEPVATNLFLRSQEFDLTWTNSASSETAGAIISPDGQLNGYRLAETAVSGGHSVYQNVSVTSGVTYTMTSYFQKGERDFGWLKFSDGVSNWGRAFNLVTGQVGNVVSGFTAPTTSTITDAGNGWWRCAITMTAGNTGTGGHDIGMMAVNGTRVYTGDITKGIYIWGAQLEAGASATSYIPTTTTALTRNADVATITGTAFSGLWRSGPGSLLVRALPSTVSGTRPLVQVDDATADNIIALRGNATNPELYIRAGGSDQATIDAGTILVDAQGRPLPYRLAGAWQAGSAAASLNSGLAVNGAPGSIPAVTQMRLGSDGTNYLNGHLQAVQYWPLRLSNASLQNASSTAGYQSIIHPVSRDTIISEPV